MYISIETWARIARLVVIILMFYVGLKWGMEKKNKKKEEKMTTKE